MESEALPTWSGIADWYDELLVAGSGPHQTALDCIEQMSPTVAGLQILDLACGQGIVARRLAELGATVIGVDFAPGMIAAAKRHGTPTGPPIDYRVDNGETLTTVANDSVDGVTCQLGLMDIEDLDATMDSLARVLRPHGWLSFVIAHPAFLAPHAERTQLDDGRPAVVITDYFQERFWRSTNPQGVRRAGNFHRRLSTYINALTDAGFVIERAEEPEANALLQKQQPLYSRIPIFFAARARLIG